MALWAEQICIISPIRLIAMDPPDRHVHHGPSREGVALEAHILGQSAHSERGRRIKTERLADHCLTIH